MAFSYSSAINNLVAGAAENIADVVTCFTDIKTVLNNGITGTDHLSASAAIAGTQLSSTAQIKQGQIGGSGANKVNIPGSETRNNVAYGTLTTPDQVTNVVLPTDGLIAVMYHAVWQESVINTARAAIFVGATQYKIHDGSGAVSAQAAATAGTGATVNRDLPLYSIGSGLVSQDVDIGAAAGAEVSTGQGVGAFPVDFGTNVQAAELAGVVIDLRAPIPGGPCYIWAAAGTYTISVQFKSSAGTVSAKNRKLWVWTLGF